MAREHVTILLLTYGEPPEAAFWAQCRYSWLILNRLTLRVAAIPACLLPLIAYKRGRGRVREWKQAGYRSPLEEITNRQCRLLRETLARGDGGQDYHFVVRPVYEFRPPLLKHILQQSRQARPDRMLIVPMYLADSDFTSGISLDDIRSFTRLHGAIRPEPEYICGFSEDPDFADVMADFIRMSMRRSDWDPDEGRSMPLILGVHGTVLNPPKKMDNGLETTMHCYRMLRKRLVDDFAEIDIGWLNHNFGGPWTSPSLDRTVQKFHEAGYRRLVYFPFGFLADNAETQLETSHAFHHHPDMEVLHLPCLNVWHGLMEYLATRIFRTLACRQPALPARPDAGDLQP